MIRARPTEDHVHRVEGERPRHGTEGAEVQIGAPRGGQPEIESASRARRRIRAHPEPAARERRADARCLAVTADRSPRPERSARIRQNGPEIPDGEIELGGDRVGHGAPTGEARASPGDGESRHDGRLARELDLGRAAERLAAQDAAERIDAEASDRSDTVDVPARASDERDRARPLGGILQQLRRLHAAAPDVELPFGARPPRHAAARMDVAVEYRRARAVEIDVVEVAGAGERHRHVARLRERQRALGDDPILLRAAVESHRTARERYVVRRVHGKVADEHVAEEHVHREARTGWCAVARHRVGDRDVDTGRVQAIDAHLPANEAGRRPEEDRAVDRGGERFLADGDIVHDERSADAAAHAPDRDSVTRARQDRGDEPPCDPLARESVPEEARDDDEEDAEPDGDPAEYPSRAHRSGPIER